MNAQAVAVPDVAAPERWAAQARHALARWAAEWGIDPAVDVRAFGAPTSPAYVPDWAWGPQGQPPSLWMGADEGLFVALERALFAADRFVSPFDRHADVGFVLSIAQRAGEDLVDTLALALGAAPQARRRESALPPALLPGRAGTLEIVVTVAGKSLWFLLPGAAARPVAAARRRQATGFGSLKEGLAPQPVQLRVVVGEARLPIGALSTLSIGDVVRLETGVDDPLVVQVLDGNTTMQAHLCALDGHRAIELVRTV